MTKLFAVLALVSMVASAAFAAPHGGGVGHGGGGFGGGHVGGNIGHGPVVVGGGYNRGGGYGGVYRGGGYERGVGYGRVGVYPGYAHNPYYGTWADRRWVSGGYYFNNAFYPVVGFQYYTCSAVNAYGQVYNYSGDVYDAQAGALNTCQMYSGVGACQIANCAIY